MRKLRKRTPAIGLMMATIAVAPTFADPPEVCGPPGANARGVLIRDDGVEIPFLFRIWPYGAGSALINGSESIPLELVPGDWSAVTVGVCDADATIAWRLPDEAADAESPRTLEGEYVRIGDDGEVVRMEARATLGHDIDPIRRCPFLLRSDLNMRSEPLPRGPRVTRWRMEFSESGPATGVFTLTAGTPTVDTTEFVAEVEILTAGGEPKRLYGSKVFWAPHNVRYQFELSYFDGASILLIRGEADSGLERMTGEFYSGATHRETFTAKRLPRGAKMEFDAETARRVDLSMMNSPQSNPDHDASESESKPIDPAAFLPPAGWFNVELLREDGAAIPFTLFVPSQAIVHDAAPVIRAGGKPVLLVGRSSAGAVTLTFPHYDAGLRLNASTDDAGLLTGEYRRTGADGSRLSMPARATRVQRLTPDIMIPLDSTATMPIDAAPVSERSETWRFDFEKGGPARGLFTIARYEPENADPIHTVRGTIMTPTGDYRFLSGDIDMQSDPPRFSLSTFDGAHAFHFAAAMSHDLARMDGAFLSGPTYRDSFTATRLAEGEDVELPDPFSDVSLKPGESRLHLPQLEDPKYAGKAVIVNIMGTWCPNCHDEAPVLADLHRRYNDQGLEILSLAFEFGLDRDGGEERALRQIERFRERHRTTWEIALAGSSDKQQAARALPALSAVKAYPTTIFLDRDHTVRAIHSGFAGPATGERHEEVKREFEALVEALIK